MLKRIVLIGLISLGFYKNIFAVNEQSQDIAFYKLMLDTNEHTIQYTHQQHQDTQNFNKITHRYSIGTVNKNAINNLQDNIPLPIDDIECIIEEIDDFCPETTNRLPVYFNSIAYVLNSDFNSKLSRINDINEKNMFASEFLYEVSKKQIYFQNYDMNGYMNHHSLAIENEDKFQILPLNLLLRSLFINFIEYPDSIKLILSQLLGSYKISFIDKSTQQNNEFIEFDSLIDHRVINLYDLLNLTKQECIKAGISNLVMQKIQQHILNILKELAIPIWVPEAIISFDTLHILPVAILTDNNINSNIVTCKLKFIKKEKQQLLYKYLTTNINNISLKQFQNENNDNAYDESELFYDAKYFFFQYDYMRPGLSFSSENNLFQFVENFNLFKRLAVITKKRFTNLGLNPNKCILCELNTPNEELIISTEHENQPICLRCFADNNIDITTNNHAGIDNGIIIGAGAAEPTLRTTEATYNNKTSINRSTNYQLNLNKCTSCEVNTPRKQLITLYGCGNQLICVDCFLKQGEYFTTNNHAGIDTATSRTTDIAYNNVTYTESTHHELNLNKCTFCEKTTPKDELVILSELMEQPICLSCLENQDIDLITNNSSNATNEQCPICFEDIIYNAMTPLHCGHLFHQKCLSKWVGKCPVCRK